MKRCRCQKPHETYDLGWYVWGWTSLRTPRWLDETCCGIGHRFWRWARSVGLIQIRPSATGRALMDGDR